MKFLFVLCLSFLMSPFSVSATGDSTQYLTSKDTIILKEITSFHKIFEHKIVKGQTLYSMARFYGLLIDDLYYYNPGLKDRTVNPGDAVNIPIPNRSIIRYLNDTMDVSKLIPVCYEIQKGDNLWGISKRVFRMPIDTVMMRNNLVTYDIHIGQRLQLGWMSIKGVPKTYHSKTIPPKWRKSAYLGKRFNARGKQAYEESGVAYWQKNSAIKSDLYTLHRKAPINSVIGITNPMNNRTVYAKVIGRIPNDVYQDNVKVVVSTKIATLLGARDPKFFVKVKYTR